MKVSNKLKIGASGFVGSTIAALADVVQKQEASAVTKIETAIETHLLEGSSIPQYTVVLFLALLAVALVFIFGVKTKKTAFFVGASVLSMIATTMPYESVPSLIGNSNASIFRPAVFFAQAEKPELPRVDIHLETKETKNARPISEVTVSLRRLQSLKAGGIIARSKFTEADFSFYQEPGYYVLKIEVPGYQITEIFLTIVPEMEAESRVIELKPTWIPLAIQRLLK